MFYTITPSGYTYEISCNLIEAAHGSSYWRKTLLMFQMSKAIFIIIIIMIIIINPFSGKGFIKISLFTKA